MAPTWEELGDAYENSKKVVIADVDCTADGNDALCQKYGVTGYPTLKYFTPPDTEGEVYEGGRELKDLKKFVKTLKPGCTAATWEDPKVCTEAQKAAIQPYIDMGAEALQTKLSEEQAKIADVTAEHEALQQSLQSQYEASEKKMKDVKATSGKEIKLIKAALQPKPAAAPKDEA